MIKKELLFTLTTDDCKITATTGSGKGGQHQNKTATKVRVLHIASGAATECNSGRSQLENKRGAFSAIQYHPKFKLWLADKIREIDGLPSLDERVNELMKDDNLIIEFGSIVRGKFVKATK